MSMPENGRTSEATELVYLPEPSWLPALVALGLTLVLVGLAAWWVYSVIGGALVLIGATRWLRSNRDAIARLPREQQIVSAPLKPRN